MVWDDDHLVFADICSPTTIANLRHNPAVEINVVDVVLRKGYRFKGTASVLAEGKPFDDIVRHLRERGIKSSIQHVALVPALKKQLVKRCFRSYCLTWVEKKHFCLSASSDYS